MSKAIIDFEKGDISALKDISDKLQAIIDKEGAVGQAWKQASDQINTQGKTNVDQTNKLAQSIDQVATNSKNLDKSIAGGAYISTLKSLQSEVTKFSQMGVDGARQIATQFDALVVKEDSLRNALNQTFNPELIAQYNTALKQNIQQQGLLGAALDKLKAGGAVLDDFGPATATATVKTVNFTTQIRQLRNQLLAMADAGQQGSQEFQDLTTRFAQMQRASKQFRIESTGLVQNNIVVAGTLSLVTGVAGAYAAAQGAAALFGDSNSDLAKALLKVNAAMSVLQGLQQLTAVLQKSSEANILFNTALRNANSSAIDRNAASSIADGAAKEIETGTTIDATVAQEGLNVAMEANPVGIVIASLVALYGIYEIYTTTLGKATDAEKEHTAAIENDLAVNNKAADSYAQEEAQIGNLLATAKNELLTRQERTDALNELKTTYPGYLASLNIENLDTATSNDLIKKQIQLLKDKATVQAAQEVYVDTLKKQIEAQNEYNAAVQKLKEGGTDITGFATGDVEKAEEKLKDATIAANAAFDSQTEASDKVAQSHQVDTDKLQAYIKQLNDFIPISEGVVQQLLKIAKAGAEQQLKQPKPVDLTAYDDQKKLILQNAQYQVDVDKNSFDAKRKLIQQTYDEEIGKINLLGADTVQQGKIAYGKYLAQIDALNEEERQKNYQADIDVANATATALLATQKGGSDAYYDARVKAIKAAAQKELDAANTNATDTKHIYAQLALDLEQLAIQKQESIINARLALDKEGSLQQYNDTLALIDKEAEAEKEQGSKTQDEINAEKLKKQQDALKKFSVASINNDISDINAGLARFGISQQDKLALTIKRLNDEQAIAITNADGNGAKIAEINAKYDQERKDAIKASIQDELNLRLNALTVYGEKAKAANEKIINDSLASEGARLIANNELQLAAQDEIDIQKAATQTEYDNKIITYQQYLEKLKILKNQEDVLNQKHADTEVQIYKDELNKKLTLLESTISVFQNSLNALDTGGLQTGLNSALTAFNQIAKAVADYKKALADPNADKAAAKDAEADAIKTASIIAIQNTINQLFSDSAAQRQQELSDNISALEDEKNAELNNANLTAKQKDAINAKYAAKEKEAKLEAWEADKQAKEEQIAIEGALNVVKAFPNPILMALAAGLTFLELGVVAAQKPPKFRHGKVDIQGPGTTTSDSIPSLISRGESVIKADSTAKWKDALVAINDDHFEDYLSQKFKGFVFPHIPDSVSGKGHEIDYEKLATAMANKMKGIIPAPKSMHFNIDKNGLHTITKEGNTRTEWKNKRYSIK